MSNYPGFPDDPGTPVAITAGFDYRLTREWLVGAALSAGTTKQTFSLNRGHFTQSAVRREPLRRLSQRPVLGQHHRRRSARCTTTSIRSVPIGITVQPNNGSTNGSNISLALETGYNFVQGQLTHGPLAGVLLQRIHIDGFTESGSFTSLAFDEQKRNSAVTELGYQASFDAGMWRPFAKAAWYHELVSTDRLVTAFLTTIAAPGFSLPAVVFGSDWGMASVGTTVKLVEQRHRAGRSLIGQFAQTGVVQLWRSIRLQRRAGSAALRQICR